MTTLGFLVTYFWRHTFAFARVYSTIKNTFVNHTEVWKQEDRPVTTPMSRKQGEDIICGVDSFEKNYYDCNAENQEHYKSKGNYDDQVNIDYFEDTTENDYMGLAESVTENYFIALAENITTTEFPEIEVERMNRTIDCPMANCSTVVFVENPTVTFYNITTEVVWLAGTKPLHQKIPLEHEYKKTTITYSGNLSSTEPPMETEPTPKTPATRSTTLHSYRSTISTAKTSSKRMKAFNTQKRFIRKLRKQT
ncbi:unnamed protein product [Arctia plantaginis]|uniref:Uncharacterized protein n=1 Tax=Arctia plantaginis TaxID=874455 RepID=A0A8S1ABK3_ARCPL|nr:unnamed protein product [Arctia plantaginis]